jgi:hypothetical protein
MPVKALAWKIRNLGGISASAAFPAASILSILFGKGTMLQSRIAR